MRTLDVLRAGKASIEQSGWRQGTIYTRSGQVNPGKCIADAVCLPRTPYRFWLSSQHRLTEAAGLKSAAALMAWNDAPERTKAEVLAVYDKAIAIAEQEASNGQ